MKWEWAGMGVKLVSDGKFIRFERYGFYEDEKMNIRAKHGPHIVVFSQGDAWGVSFADVLLEARETLNATYGLKLEDDKGITLEVLN